MVNILLMVVMSSCALVCTAEASGVWLDVPFVKQEKNGCGAASIAMVMQFWQRQQQTQPDARSDPARIQRTIYSSPARGIYASDLQRYFAENGFRTFVLTGTRDDLRQHLDKGRPLIVALKPSGRLPLHYVVVAGMEPNLVLLNDPAERKLLKLEWASFEKEWKDAGNWTLLAVPQSEGAASAQ
jgi:ABC-type bacteriocin/lantibiotic exporter with double-glycine peptidase domain